MGHCREHIVTAPLHFFCHDSLSLALGNFTSVMTTVTVTTVDPNAF